VLDYQKKGHHLELFRRYVMASSFAPLAHDKAIGKLLVGAGIISFNFVQIYSTV
jgi:hypothetical protein